MEIALYVLLSIAIIGEAIIIFLGIWASKDDKKSKGKSNIDEEIYLLENELWKLDAKLRSMKATFDTKKKHLECLQFIKEKEQEKEQSNN